MLHIIQNDPDVPPGNIVHHLSVPYKVHRAFRDGLLPRADDVSALIVLGGTMGANDDSDHPFLSDLKSFIRQVVGARRAYLGICLGGQLLASAFGACVRSDRWAEIGVHNVSLTSNGKRDRLFHGMPDTFSTFQWHNDSFDIPREGILLATSQACHHQAFRMGDNAWGLQFHPEVTEQIIHAWCAAGQFTIQQTEELVARFNSVADRYRSTARLLLDNFLAAAGIGRT